MDAAAGDFHLAKGSPAINGGTDPGLFFPTDLDGNSRPAFRAFDIGTYEYMDSAGSFRVLMWGEAE